MTSPASIARIVGALRAGQLFRDVPEAALGELARASSLIRASAGQILLSRGDPGNSMMVVLSGRVKISTLSPRGNELVVNGINPGGILGELSVLDDLGRSADATAAADTELLVIPRPVVLNFLKAQPTASLAFLNLMAGKLRATTERLESAVFLELPARLFRRLRDLAADCGRPCADGIRIEHGLSQSELAAAVSVTRESVNKLLNFWEELGLIEHGRGFILIRSLPGLAREADCFHVPLELPPHPAALQAIVRAPRQPA